MGDSLVPKPELLAPAGTREALEAVVEAGADAVYVSGKLFGMRQHADWLNFDQPGLRGAADFVHSRGRRLYVTLNGLYTDAEIRLLPEYIEFLQSINPDAFIVQDLGLIGLLKDLAVSVPLHASTMMNIHNVEGARVLKSLGFERVVVSQCLSLEHAERIGRESGMAIELFLHGDTCTATHSLCQHSGVALGEQAGRGRCMKSCRWSWDFVSMPTDGDASTLHEGIHALARKDLCLYKQTPRFIRAGVAGLKIEGRSRAAGYLRPIVAAYRDAIDTYCQDPLAFAFDARRFRTLRKDRIRNYTTSWNFGNPGAIANDYDGKREPRFFSLAIEEKPVELVEIEGFPVFLPDAGQHPGKPLLTVRCGTVEAARLAALAGADRIMIGGEISARSQKPLGVRALLEIAAEFQPQGVPVVLATPRMTCDSEVTEYRLLFEHIPEDAFHAVSVHNLGMWRLVSERTNFPVLADFSFNVFNSRAADELLALGFAQATFSIEGNLAQAAAIQKDSKLPLELIVHGNLPGMHTRHCVIAALAAEANPDGPCPAPCQDSSFALRDAVGQLHPVVADQQCRNHILMGKDLCTLTRFEPFLRGGFRSLRLELPFAADRVVAETTAIYRRAIDALLSGTNTTVDSEQGAARLRDLTGRPQTLGAFGNALASVAKADPVLVDRLFVSYS